MPLVDDKLLVRFGKLLRTRQLLHLQAQGFTKLDDTFDIEHCFAATVANVNMYGSMFVAVKEEPISVLFKNLRHSRIIAEVPNLARFLFLSRVTAGEAPAKDRNSNIEIRNKFKTSNDRMSNTAVRFEFSSSNI
jgi:hypothetical protein